MNYEQLYIDGVLMDTDEKTQILLDVKSNLLADISSLSANHSYTIQLPKTVHNLTVLQHPDRIGNNAVWPYSFHSARFFRNGVEIIKDGRVALLSAKETLEVALVWGLSSAFDVLKENDFKLTDLSASDFIKWETANTPDTPAAFFARGYGYCGYSPWINDGEDKGWQSADATEFATTSEIIDASPGWVDTGTMVGDIVRLNPQARANWGYIIAPFWLGCHILGNYLSGGTANDRLWAVLDSNDRVVDIAPPADGNLHTVSFHALSSAAKILINIDLSVSQSSRVTIFSSVPNGSAAAFGGAAGNTSLKYIHPSVAVRWVLDQIMADTGITFAWSGDALTMIDNLAIPLVKKKANYLTQSLTAEASLQPTTSLGQMSVAVSAANDIFSNAVGVVGTSLTVARDCGVMVDAQAMWSWDTTGTQSNSSTTTGYGGTSTTIYQYIYKANYILMTITHTNGDVDEFIIGRQNAETANIIDQDDNIVNGRLRHIIAGYGHIDLLQGDVIGFELKNAKGKLNDMSLASGYVRVMADASDEVMKGNNFPIVDNLPEIKTIDFVKFLAAITATFPLQDTANKVVTFVPIKEIWGNASIAADWTRRIIPSYDTDKPKEVDFKLSGWAQNNWFRWLEDDTVHGNYDGNIPIADNTLDTTRNIFTFPFAASDGSSVPTYTRVKTEGTFGGADIRQGATYTEPMFKECKPRIMSVREDGNGLSELYFDINMQTIVENDYADLAAMLQSAKIIKEKVRLSNIEILNFSETQPVYLAQHGAYFAVLDIKAADDGTAEVTMARINVQVESPEPPQPIPDYLCFTALEAGTFTLTIPAAVTTSNLSYVEYSLDSRNWTKTDNTSSEVVITTPSVAVGGKVYWRGSGTKYGVNDSTPAANNSVFSATGNFNVSGNALSLLYAENFVNYIELPSGGRLGALFYLNTKLISASELSLPSTIATISCYNSMFKDCSNLVSAPALPATTLYNYAYRSMFWGCTSLVTAPSLPATSLGSSCYQYMYYGCTSLTTPPSLPATTLKSDCYGLMFYGCTSLTYAPAHPATSLEAGCYNQMYRGCTSLTTAPILPATTLAATCYYQMFYGCTSLNYVKCLATDISATNCTTNWLYNVSTTGTFIQASGVSWASGASGIPTNWLPYNDGGTIPNTYTACDWINNTTQSRGGVDLGFKFRLLDYSVEFKCKQDVVSNGMPCCTKGAADSGSIWFYNYIATNIDYFRIYACKTSGYNFSKLMYVPNDTNLHTLKYTGASSGCNAYNNGEVIGTAVDLSSLAASESTYNLYIFGRGETGADCYVGRIYYLKVWNTATEASICDLVPCTRNSDSAAGFWDKTRLQFFTSSYWSAGNENS